MPLVTRRRPTSPLPRAMGGAPAPTASRGGRCGSFIRLSTLAILLGAMVYFATGFQQAVDVATSKMTQLRAAAGSGMTTTHMSNTDLVGLTSRDDVVELIRPDSDVRDSGGVDASSHDNEDSADAADKDVEDLGPDNGASVNDDADEDAADEEAPDHDHGVEQEKDEEPVVEKPQDPVPPPPLHEEDEPALMEPGKAVTEEVALQQHEEIEEEDLDNEEHAVDENAQDVVVEAAPNDDDDDDDDDDEAEDEALNGKSITNVDEGPKKMPKFTREELEERGFGHVLYAYRVVAPYVAIRTKPSPIGALSATSKDKMGLTKNSVKMGEIIVGYKLAKVHGLWLKVGPYTWAPVTKKETLDGPFHPVMKQIRKISIPGNLRKYWRTRVLDCDVLYKKEESRNACKDKNMVRNGVLNVMRRMKLIDSSMDPDIHPFPSTSRHSGNRKMLQSADATAEASLGSSHSDVSALGLIHAPSLTDQRKPMSVVTIATDDASEQVDATRNEGQLTQSSPKNQAITDSRVSSSSTSSALPSQSLEVKTLDGDAKQERLEEQDEESSESEDSENMSMQDDQQEDEEEDEVDTDIQCKQFKFWHLCARHARCAWRRLPNKEYCDLDLDPPVDTSRLPPQLRPDPKYDFTESLSRRPGAKYFVYQPSGGWNNQRLLAEHALIICKLLNRTCVLPPAAPHSNYFFNYNNIPASAIVGMPRVLDFDSINKIASAVAVPEGMTYKSFLDDMLFKEPRRLSVKTIVRDVTKYKPGALKKWAERDIIKLFSGETADVLFFANQTLWGTIEWKGSLYGWKEKKQVHLAVTYPNHMKQIARKLADNLGPFHAVHVRRGDKVFETSFSRLYHDPDWYASRISEYRSTTPKVYIATDEPNRAYFDAFKQYQLNIVFWENLPGFDQVLKPYLQHFPRRMFMDILGMIEQLLCTYAVMFLGSGYSTFTTFILRLRKYRQIIAVDTSYANPLDSLPDSVRNIQSTCDPLKSLGHAKPC